MKREQKITLGEMRQSGPRRLQIFCGGYKCAHSVVINADRWGDPTWSRNSPGKVCGHRGADIRPLFEHAKMGGCILKQL